jgi:hypothetical protein
MHALERITIGGRKVSDYNRVAKVMTAIQHSRSLLKDAGFARITKCNYREGNRPDTLIDSIDRTPESFYVEAEKTK